MFKGFSTTTQRLLLDHLPGGKHHTQSEDILDLQDVASVPTTNTSPERDFAILDRLLREKPNAKLIAIESMMMYRQNKTSLWLDSQSDEDKRKLLKVARKRAQ